MASSRKRTRAQLASAASEDSLISIKLAEGGAALAADKFLLFTVSTCARGLPGAAAEWDVSSLLIEGQPVSRAVVVAWLHAAHSLLHSEPFAGEAQQEPPLNCSASGLAQLLAFADAVGSSDRVFEACLPPLEQLQFRLQAGEQQQQQDVQLDVGGAYLWVGDEHLHLTKQGRGLKAASEEEVFEAASPAAKAQLTQQFARQLEALLYLAHRLELDSLAQVLHSCVHFNTAWFSSLLTSLDCVVDPRVVSARVLEAAAGPGQHSQLAFTNSLVTEAASFVSGPCRRQVFKPLNLSAAQKQPLKFKAKLAEDFMGAGSKGQTVDERLDLFGEGFVRVGDGDHIVQLLVGSRVTAVDLEALRKAHEEAAAAE